MTEDVDPIESLLKAEGAALLKAEGLLKAPMQFVPQPMRYPGLEGAALRQAELEAVIRAALVVLDGSFSEQCNQAGKVLRSVGGFEKK